MRLQFVYAPKGSSFYLQNESSLKGGPKSSASAAGNAPIFVLGVAALASASEVARRLGNHVEPDEGSGDESVLNQHDHHGALEGRPAQRNVQWVGGAVRHTSNSDSADSDVRASDEFESGDEADELEEDEDCEDGPKAGSQSIVCPKLWSKAEFPEGIKGAANWDLCNLYKVQSWKCPCPDRDSCLSTERHPKIDALYDFRKTFQTTYRKRGLRDSFRTKFLEPAYSKEHGTFSRSIRIGDKNDNCVAAAALAAGLSFCTFANARTDVTKSRPYHAGRVQKRDKLDCQQRQVIEQYICDLRSTMEGDKGGRREREQWHTGKRAGDDASRL